MWCCKEVYRFPHIYIYILLIPTPLVLGLFCSSIPTSFSFKKCFLNVCHSCLCIFVQYSLTLLKECSRLFKNLDHVGMAI